MSRGGGQVNVLLCGKFIDTINAAWDDSTSIPFYYTYELTSGDIKRCAEVDVEMRSLQLDYHFHNIARLSPEKFKLFQIQICHEQNLKDI